MRLLLDQNLSPRLVSLLRDVFPGSLHVRDLGLERADDEVLWDRARSDGLIIVSKDADFHERSFLRGHPPKVVWVRVGNASTARIATVLRQRAADLSAFASDSEASFLSLS